MTTQVTQTQLAVDKIRQIGQDILDEPRRFDMATWFRKIITPGVHGRTARTMPPCGTTACFAGTWAIRYLGVDPSVGNIQADLRLRLGSAKLPSLADACEDALRLPDDRLFYEAEWPYLLHMGIDRFNPGTKAYARYFVKVVLEDYIRTNGWTETGKEN